MKIINILIIGGTNRALITFKSLLTRKDINILMAIFMPGYSDEQRHCDSLVRVAREKSIQTFVGNKISEEIVSKVNNLDLDIILGIGVWRSILPKNFINASKYGFIGVHGTPLPEYRGWAGIYWQIINGESKLGMRALRLNEGIDDGPIVCDHNGSAIEEWIDLNNENHINEILHEYDEKHIKLIHKILDPVFRNKVQYKKQSDEIATYSCHRGPEDGEIDWKKNTKEVFNFVRAQSHPLPGAFTYFNGNKVYLWRVRPRYDFISYIGRIPGKVVHRDRDTGSAIILTKDGGIEVFSAQIKGKEKNIIPIKVFDSVRERCKTRIESYLDSINY